MQPCMKSNWFLLFVIYQRIFVLSSIRQQSYSIYFKKKRKRKKTFGVDVKKKAIQCVLHLKFHKLLINRIFPVKRGMHPFASFHQAQCSLLPSPAPLVQSNVYEVQIHLRNALLQLGSNRTLLEWNISRAAPFVHFFPFTFFIVSSDYISETKPPAFKHKWGKAVSVCLYVCVHVLGWGARMCVCVPSQKELFMCLTCLQALIKYSAG